jgi:hypothetical protein
MINNLYELIGNIVISFGRGIVQCESIVFNHFDYIRPIFIGIKHVESMFCNINIGTPTFH